MSTSIRSTCCLSYRFGAMHACLTPRNLLQLNEEGWIAIVGGHMTASNATSKLYCARTVVVVAAPLLK
jgi:hypothetical protein